MRGSASSSPRISASSSMVRLDFEDVPAGLVAGLARAAVVLPAAERLADLAVALADAAGALLAVAELRDVDLRQREC